MTARAARRSRSPAPYFVEEVRKYLEEHVRRQGAVRAAASPSRRRSTCALQDAANAPFDAGLRRVDKRRGFRRPKRNVIAEGSAIETVQDDRWKRPISVGDIVPAVVAAVSASRATARTGGAIRLRVGTLTADLPRRRLRVDAARRTPAISCEPATWSRCG